MESIEISIPLALFIAIILMSLVADSEEKRRGSSRSPRFLNNTYFDLFSMLAKLCKVDGPVKKEEIELISIYMKQELKLDSNEQQRAILIFRKAKESRSSFKFHTKRLKSENEEDVSFLKEIVDMLFSVSIVDGSFSHEQESFIIDVINIFEVYDNDYFAYKQARAESGYSPDDDYELERKYFLSLGLTDAAEVSQIKNSYRKLVKQYHPDNVQYLGAEFLHLADQKMKEINEAYNYLKGRFDL